MPILPNMNFDDININKRVAQAQLRQARMYTPDVLPEGVDPSADVDITTQYNSLIKSLSYISLMFKQILTSAQKNLERFQQEDNDSVFEEYAFDGSRNARYNIFNKQVTSTNINSLEKETVNVNIYVNSIQGQFSSLKKMQKNKLLKLCKTIFKHIDEIIEYYPDTTKMYEQLQNIFFSLNISLGILEDELMQSGERNIANTLDDEIKLSGAGMISGSTTSMIGSGISRTVRNAHAPSKYVNQNWNFNLEKRNN